jgi:membrane-bound lytic murein transglycosylase MltF
MNLLSRAHALGLLGVILALWGPLFPSGAWPQSAGAHLTDVDRGVLQTPSTQRYTDDLDGLLRRRILRVLVVPGKTHYFIDRGTQRGLAFEELNLFGSFLERRYPSRLVPSKSPSKRSAEATARLRVVFIPVRRDHILEALNEGRGDVAVANLTVTPSREKLVDFTDPFLHDVNEIIVSGPGSPPLRSFDDLAGQTVHVRPTTSYFESLTALNQRLVAAGRPPMRLVHLPNEIEDEDKLEMLNAGLIKLAVVDEPLFDFWKQVFPAITAHRELAVRAHGDIAWAVRKTNPELRAALNEFLATEYRRGSAERNILLTRYLKSTRWVKSAHSQEELERYRRTVDLFRRYAAQYRFDHLLVLAQGYQESQLDQSKVSPVGAVGLMQIMPATGREMAVGDIRQADPNVHAGTRYLRRLIDVYFNGPELTELNRMMFAFASYNAGAARISRLRNEARKLGYDPNLWFGNVELVVADRIGREPVQYVGNILKYYVAYKLLAQQAEEQAPQPSPGTSRY